MRTWFITGASRGLGMLIAKAALDAGDAVVAAARNPDAVTEALGSHDNLLAVKLDVTDQGQANVAVAAAVKRFGRIDVLVNNAGFGVVGAVEEASAEEIARVYATNVFGLLGVTRAVLPHMRRERSGRVFNISSIGGYQSRAGFGIYCSTKFAVEAISEAMYEELAPLGIYVTVVEPGAFRTDFAGRSLQQSSTVIADYAETAGKRRKEVDTAHGSQPGDPARAAQAIITAVEADEPPALLMLGPDALKAIRGVIDAQLAELKDWENTSLGTDLSSP